LPSEENKEKKVLDQRIGRKQKRKKIPNQKKGRKQKRKEKLLIKDRKKIEEICRKVFVPDNIWTIQNCHQVNKKERKPRPKMVLHL